MSSEVRPEAGAATAPGAEHLARLMAQFPDCRSPDVRLADDIPTAIVPESQVVEVCRFLRDDPALRYTYLAELCGIDYPERADRFDVTYILHSFEHNSRLRLKVRVGEEEPTIPSVVSVWPTANWLEREVYDLFGVRFEGHPELRRILLPEDWEGHPLRRDEPLGDEEVPYTAEEARRY